MMKFLKSFFLTLRERFSKVRSSHGLNATISDSEKLARYIFSTRHFKRQPARVKAEAYMRNRGEARFDLGNELFANPNPRWRDYGAMASSYLALPNEL
jgi:hypothetical protein